MPCLHWVIAGEGPLRGELEAHAAGPRPDGTVSTFWDMSPEPLRVLADADVFVMSSREEGLGTSVLDAMARGIPVASTTAGGLPEMLADGAGLLVPPEQPSALADAVARLLTDPELQRSSASSARWRSSNDSALNAWQTEV